MFTTWILGSDPLHKSLFIPLIPICAKVKCHWQISSLKSWSVATNLRLLGIVGMEWNIIQAIKSNIGNFLASSSVRKTLRKRKIVHGNLFNISVLFSLHKTFFLLWKVKVVYRCNKMLVKTKTLIRTKMLHIYQETSF